MTIPLLSFWLIPIESERLLLQSLINQMAQRYQSSTFCPHLTLFSTPITALNDPLRSASSFFSPSEDRSTRLWDHHLDPILNQCPPVSLNATSVQWGQTFAKTVFIQLETTLTLQRLIQHLQQSVLQSTQESVDPAPIGGSLGQTIDPHVSLIYQQMDDITKAAIAQSTMWDQRRLSFSELQIVQAPAQFETQEDVKTLRCIYRHPLNNT